jgi:hypothetical protein
MGALISWIKSLFKPTIFRSQINGLVKVIKARHRITRNNKNMLNSDPNNYKKAYKNLINRFTIIPNSNIQ